MDEEKDDNEYNMFTVNSTTNQTLAFPDILNGVNLTMEIDTDAAKSVISENTLAQLWPNHKAPSVKPSSATLKVRKSNQLVLLLFL